MSRGRQPLPAVAPRGQHFTVLHHSHVAGPDVRTVVRDAGRELAGAIAIADRIDWRLQPQIALTNPKGTHQ